ncbi:MAG: pyruvate kinase [Ruminococcus sp.]|nr:pyruvate kinase [Ruminococcus sp.]
MKKTKIICTLGPACNNKETLVKMMEEGMNVARINLSHGTYDDIKANIQLVKEASAECGKEIAILLDTKGPEVRVGLFENSTVTLKKGQDFELYKEDVLGTEKGVSISYPRLVDLFKADPSIIGRQVLFDDGKIVTKVKSTHSDRIILTVEAGGKLSNRKSLNIPDYHINMPYVSAQDRRDLEFGLEQGVNYIAASFVRSAEDVTTLRDFIDSLGFEKVEIISKIESQSGVSDIDNIIRVSDGIMIARGDMGVEIPFIKLPEIQKSIIRKCVTAGKYVITATQLLESMTTSPRPTRAEISDVANAVYDGTSAVMLSGESAAGKYPVESVKALCDICTEAEKHRELHVLRDYLNSRPSETSFRENICYAAKTIAENIGATAIVVESKTGSVARAMAHCRPDCDIIAVVTSESVCKKLALNWGVTPVYGKELKRSDEITLQALEKALETGIVKKGDAVIVISSNKTVPTSGTDTLNIRIV